jgi:4-hydroxybenzoate polyprenyltransferase
MVVFTTPKNFLLRIRRLLEMIRFSHTLFALPFALLAAVMAWWANAHVARPSWPLSASISDTGWKPVLLSRGRELAGILLAMVFARSAAMAFNRLVDRHLDALNPRTRTRHLPTGTLSVPGVAAFTVLCGLGFVASTLLFLPDNPWPLYASLPVLLFLFAYSFTKRFTVLAHFWLGTALALAPLAAWVAIRAEVALAPLLLGAAVIFWVAGFDMIYACQDVEFDAKTQLYSIPARFGVPAALRLAALCHAGMVLLLALLPLVFSGFGRIYLGGIGIIAALLIYEHSIVRPNELARVNQAFFGVNAVVSLGLFIAGAIDLWLKGS